MGILLAVIIMYLYYALWNVQNISVFMIRRVYFFFLVCRVCEHIIFAQLINVTRASRGGVA